VIGDVIARRLGVDRNAVTESTDLYADLGASYEDVRGIANELGGLFAVTVSDSAVKPMNTVGDILNCVESAMID
jgi:acyl carrier protein